MNKRFLYSAILLILITEVVYAFFTHDEKENTLSNFLKETHWVFINHSPILGLSTDSVMKLIPMNPKFSTNYSAVHFVDNKSFKSDNTWECGNDCFINATGLYSLESDSILKVICQKVEGNSYCGELNFSKKEQVFKISIKKDTIKLTRLNK